MKAAANPTASARHDMALGALTARIALELGHLASLSADVQTALSLCSFHEHTDPAAIRGLQGIDRITQSLEDLERLAHALAAQVPDALRIPAPLLLSQLRLHDLLARFDPGSAQAVAAVQGQEAGDIQWF